MPVAVFEDLVKGKEIIRKLPLCPCLPKLKGFKSEGNRLEVVFSDAKPHGEHMNEEEFIGLIRDIYSCALNGVYLGPISRKSLLIAGGRTVVIPNFIAKPWIVSGRIVNPRSFFTSVQTLADSFKSSGGIVSKISREKMSAILNLMDELGLKVQQNPLFLPSLGVWRHSKTVEEIKSLTEHAHLSMQYAEVFLSFLSGVGRIFHSMEEAKKEVFSGERWHAIFSDNETLSDIDPTAVAFLMELKERELYIFDSTKSVEMHTMVRALANFEPNSKIVELHNPLFTSGPGKEIELPHLHLEEFEWFLKTFFGSPVVFEGDKDFLFNITKGELFAISELLSRGKWRVENGVWHVVEEKQEKLSATKFLIWARKLAKTVEKPNLGIELVELSQRIAGRDLEIFESLRAFFHKVLGDYSEMKRDLERASKFGNKTFRNAYYSVVLAMNGMEYSLLTGQTSKLVEITRTYAQLVSSNANIAEMYKRIITALEKLKNPMARRIEVMVRNYMGIKLMYSGKNEEALNEFETALSITKEYKLRDLTPLVEINIGYAVFPRPSYSSYNRLLHSLRDSVVEGLWKAAGSAQLFLASDLIEMGEFQRAKCFLKNAQKVFPQLKSEIDSLFVRMKVENMEFDEIDSVEDQQERNYLELLSALYKDDDKRVLELLKTTKSSESEELSSIASGNLDFEQIDPSNYLATYFVAKKDSNRSIKNLKRMGRYFYTNTMNVGKVFYEEQLSKAYQRKKFPKSANYHMKLAMFEAKQIGLDKRAKWLSQKVKALNPDDDSYEYEFLGSVLVLQEFKTSEEMLSSLSVEASKILKRDVICELNGVEKIRMRAKPDGIVFNTDEEIDLDFVWIFGQKRFVYSFSINGGTVYLSFDTTNLSMDEALYALDQIVPIYALHIEKSIAAKISNFDSLTGLYSRRYIMERLDEEVERAKRYGESLSVAMIDIDDFKRVNDEYGHDVGDEALRRVSKQIHEAVRSIDVVGRYGGDELLVLFPHTPAYRAIGSCERIKKAVENVRLTSLNLTISIGLADSSECISSPQDLIKCADIALYLAKEGGKNRVFEYSQSEVKKWHTS